MQIQNIMTTPVETATPNDDLATVAIKMAKSDLGFLPVANDEKLLGTITDRDLVVAGMAERLPLDTPVSEIMNHDVKYCFEDDSVNEIAANLGDQQVRRLPVVNRDKRLVGIVSLADISHGHDHHDVSADALSEITRKGGMHNHPH